MKIALLGYGKMGHAIEDIAIERGHEVVLRIGIENVEDFTFDAIKQADVAIEFTGPDSAKENVEKCIEAKVPVVCGSTGWLADYIDVAELCRERNGTFLYASNFSIGVNIFFELNSFLARLMAHNAEYDVIVDETHHTQKRDAPSGTAITLAQQVLDHLSRKKQWVNHPSNNADDLVINSFRIDPAPGTHSIKYTSPIDDIEIKHTAHNRQGFALGAVLAAEFIHDKKGIYTMKDVLGF